MVNLHEIEKSLKKLKSNNDRLNYLNDLLKEIDDKKLIKLIEKLIEDIKELDSIAQIEIKGKVDWSIPRNEEPVQERRLERQVASEPIVEKKKEEDFKGIRYDLPSNLELYTGRENVADNTKYSGSNQRANLGNSFIDKNMDVIDGRVNSQYLGNNKSNHEGIDRKYEDPNQESKGYSSASQQFHEQHKEKLRKHIN